MNGFIRVCDSILSEAGATAEVRITVEKTKREETHGEMRKRRRRDALQ